MATLTSQTELITRATGLLGVDGELASRCLEELVAEEGVVADPLPVAESPGRLGEWR